MARLCLSLVLLFLAAKAQAYPQFIGYKYSSCLTCHYNSHGNGPINDYGRALWAAEIAGRFMAGSKTAEDLSESSGFLGKTQLPSWIRPGIKARQLWYRTNPGRPSSQSRSITMQADVNAAIFLDQDQKYTFVGSFGYVPTPFRLSNRGAKTDEWISREHYFRWQAKEDLWIYLGMMDRVYGIRHADHTAFSRSRVGVAQNDQSHGIVAHYIQTNWEYTVNLFAGNLYQTSALQEKGGSMMLEYDLKEAFRVGTSVLYSSNDYVKKMRTALHAKYGLGYGSALLFETGLIQDTPKVGDSKKGYYVYSEAMQKVTRGYHLFVTGQAYKSDMTAANADTLRFGTGVLAFPRQRYECRVEVQNERNINSGASVPKDNWALLGQLHISL